MWDLIIVILAVALAAFWIGRGLWRTAKGKGEGCGCKSCSCGDLQDIDSILPLNHALKTDKPSHFAKEE